MDTLGILAIVLVSVIAIAGLLLYSTRKSPIKKLDKKESLPGKEEFSEGLTPFETEPIQEYIPEPPAKYGKNNITALVRDPNWLHLYWELHDDHAKFVQEQHGPWHEATPILRIYTANSKNLIRLFDVAIDEQANRWDVRVPDNAHLVVDLSIMYPTGKVVTLLRSNPVITPRAFMSDVVDEEWMLVDDKQRKLYKRIGVGKGPSSPDFYNPLKD